MSHIILWSAVLGVLCFAAYWTSRRPTIPTINVYPWDLTRKRAHEAYNRSAKVLVASGFARFHGPFRIITTQGSKVILPSSYTDWVKTCKELDHQALVHDDFFGDYPGFDGLAVVTNPDRILIDVTRTKLSQTAQLVEVLNKQLTQALKDVWTDNKSWHTLSWSEDTMSLISRMSASVFVGSELAADSEWQNLTTTYTVNMFKAVAALRQWPSFLRRIVNHVLPQSKICREQVRLTRRKVQTVLNCREREKQAALAIGQTPRKYEDMMTWLDEVAAGRPYDRGASQLALAVSALHTTSEAFRQILLDLCLHPNLLEPVREEIKSAIIENGWSAAALAKMQLVDSVMKESQRLKSAIVGIERKAIRNTVLPNGMKLPRGSTICIDSSDMWSPDVHPNPQTFDGYRFLRIRQREEKGHNAASFVSSTKEHNTFGAGKFICPGRFFVANELKIALAHVLLKYDIRLKEGYIPRDLQVGFYPTSDPEAKVEVRRRNWNL